jgi:hypothetical protein
MWSDSEHKVPTFERSIQTCILFLETRIYIDLDWAWTNKLLELIRDPNRWQDHWHLRDIGPLPAGVREEMASLRSPWYQTWYVNLNLPDFTIDATATQPNLQTAEPPRFDCMHRALRIAITEDCSVVIPHIVWDSLIEMHLLHLSIEYVYDRVDDI